MKNNLKNKIAIVTGGSRGIGLAIVLKFLKEKAKVYILDKNTVNDERFQNYIDKGVLKVCKCDFLDPKNVLIKFKNILDEEAKIDILVNNARSRDKTDLETENFESWTNGLNIMLTTPFLLSQQFILSPKAFGGCIINISSVTSNLISNESPVYHISKGAINSMTNYLAVQGGKIKKIRVNSILPGLIIQEEHTEKFNSEQNQDFRNACQFYQPMNKVGSERDIASLVSFLVSDQAKYISGSSIVVDGAATLQDQITLLLNYLKKNNL